MTLVIGGAFSGRHDFVFSHFKKEDCYEISSEDVREFFEEQSRAQSGTVVPSKVCERISSFKVVIATEAGCGIIPLSTAERNSREANGRLNCALSGIAKNVILMTAGIPQFIKGKLSSFDNLSCEKNFYAVVFRHGQTISNVLRRFAGGLSDVSLNETGILQAENVHKTLLALFGGFQKNVKNQILNSKKVFVSPMARALKTAEIIFPDSEIEVVEDFREMRMGLFENMSHEELSLGMFADGSKSKENAQIYQNWLDSKGALPAPSSKEFPGESIKTFTERVCKAFRKLIDSSSSEEIPIVVAHGGVQMAICYNFFAGGKLYPYFSWQSDNAAFRFGEILT
ncbi:histidine phosphatase family protein [Treponema zioleckii]|uniref:histidine phosphatase family protein n=1 Tax=Treponema zioleckii TaxID=331680 RepID=UPI00168A580D|nr:histidine phosphatase family protein [Treponema zioleckii]